MRCPRCGKEYEKHIGRSVIRTEDFNIVFYCNECDTHVTVEITQALLNLTYSLMDMGFVHPEAKVA